MAEQINLTFAYDRMPESQTHHVSGVIGGSNSIGEIVAHIFHEFTKLEPTQIATVTPEGQIAFPTPDPEKSRFFERRIVCTLVLSPEMALSIGQWFQTNAQSVLNARAAATQTLPLKS